MQVTGIDGAYRGGLSKDGRWAGTTYLTSTLFDAESKGTVVLAGGRQQCNPSMNPFPSGGPHTDYMMILAFGGTYGSVSGPVSEGLHENFWIYNKADKIVWQGRRPDEKFYLRWDKPEWSTHPRYATAVALPIGDENNGDLFVVKIGDLAEAKTDTVAQAQGYLKIGSGSFNSDSFSHLWVDETK